MAGRPGLTAGFRDFGTGERFCIDWMPAGAARGALMLLPPFGEEMNKSRRTVALAANKFAEAGFVVRSVDAFGTGDSPGEFGDATWSQWVADYRAVARSLERDSSNGVTLWAVRAGSLLATEVCSAGQAVVMWQPVVSGETFFTQLLRLKMANDILVVKGPGAPSTRELRERLQTGETLEIAGYSLTPALVLPMAARSVNEWVELPHNVQWLETGAELASEPPPGSVRAIASLKTQGVSVQYARVAGEPFWSTVETTENRSIAAASIEMLRVAVGRV